MAIPKLCGVKQKFSVSESYDEVKSIKFYVGRFQIGQNRTSITTIIFKHLNYAEKRMILHIFE